MTALPTLLGAGLGLGVMLIANGLRRRDALAPPRRRVLSGLHRDRLLGRLGAAVGCAVLVGALTRWPVAVVLAGAGAYALPGMLSGTRQRARQVARTEAIAGWAEMLRDTLSAAAGL